MRQHACSGLFSWCLSSYTVDIHCYLKRKELKSRKMIFQSPQLNHRPKLVDWIRSVSANLKLSITTVHLAVRLMDLFMDAHSVSANKLVPVCITCLFIAAKFDEDDAKVPKIKDLPDIVKNKASKEDFLFLEGYILESFNWFVSHVTPAHFAEYYSMFAVVNGDSDHFETPHRHLQDLVHSSIRDFLDISLSEVYLNEFMSSKVAASCLLAARLEHGIIPVWPKILSAVTGYSVSSLQPCIDLLMEHNKEIQRTEVNKKTKLKEEFKFDSGYESCSPDIPAKKRLLLRK